MSERVVRPLHAAPPFPARGWAVAAITLLAVVFPPLMAATSLAEPGTDAEIARLRQAIADPTGDVDGPAVLFYGALLPVDAEELTDAQLLEQLPRLRWVAVLGVLVLAGLAYTVAAVALGRTHAVLSNLVLGLLPPIAVEGALLRPEVPVTVFTTLGVALLMLFGKRYASLQVRSPAVRAAHVVTIAAAAATAFALAVVCVPVYGVTWLVLGGCMLLAVVFLMRRFVKVLRRRRLMVLPFLPIAKRLTPWLLTPFLSLVIARSIPGLAAQHPASESTAGLIPQASWLAIPMWIAAAIGAALWLIRIGLLVGPARYVTNEMIAFVFVAVLLIHRLKFEDPTDALPAALPFALVVAAGLKVVIVLGIERISRESTT